MKNNLKRVLNRFKKFFWVILLIPILTAGISYVLEMNTPKTYTAYSEIALGNYEYDRMTEPRTVKDFLSNEAYLKILDDKYGLSMSPEDLSKDLTIGEKPGKILTLQLVGKDSATVEAGLSDVAEAFIKESDEIKQERKNFFQEKINKLESLPDSPESAVKKQEFIYELQLNILNMRDTIVNEPVTIKDQLGDPIKRAVFGFLVGVIISMFILILPEFLRQEK
ncbi:hypothetical protein [Guptibacillus algicola]|uniref:hypothetical protein n=1 Tax=Guptibacillus algicola TaxID=225844 RepID=UPI001CD4D011|nr:hypothetical protein [Alkalihalobacillus algicola]MCA0986855.1 hypothetical protein [Alkalihalobacillus algicola]